LGAAFFGAGFFDFLADFLAAGLAAALDLAFFAGFLRAISSFLRSSAFLDVSS
jgi:hypothetical protein